MTCVSTVTEHTVSSCMIRWRNYTDLKSQILIYSGLNSFISTVARVTQTEKQDNPGKCEHIIIYSCDLLWTDNHSGEDSSAISKGKVKCTMLENTDSQQSQISAAVCAKVSLPYFCQSSSFWCPHTTEGRKACLLAQM